MLDIGCSLLLNLTTRESESSHSIVKSKNYLQRSIYTLNTVYQKYNFNFYKLNKKNILPATKISVRQKLRLRIMCCRMVYNFNYLGYDISCRRIKMLKES